MTPTGLPARAAYGLVALAAGGVFGFRLGVVVLGRLLPIFRGVRPAPGYNDFVTAIAIGAVASLTGGLLALTLPWIRRKKRRGRLRRTIVSGIFVFVVAIGIAAQDLPAVVEVSMLIWIIATLAYTFIRYGVRDQTRRSISPVRAS